jgi:chemotaxis protein methyltransferase CheR
MMAATAPIEPLSEETFNLFRSLIYSKTGINMREAKQILLSNRLRKRIVALDLAGYTEYYHYLVSEKGSEQELARFIDAVSTNETYFYRETNHFSALENTILPELLADRRTVRIWSAGCSTGEEPYSLRIVFEEGRGRLWSMEAQAVIVATDISQEVIAKARKGLYGERSLRFVPDHIRRRYFVKQENGTSGVSAQLRKGVDFRVHNLLQDEPPERKFELIFCRNVMIYFDKATQRKLADESFARALDPQGYLCIGHSESLTGTSQRFRYVPGFKAPVYRRIEEDSLR